TRRRTPRSPLFPYTTLFRSPQGGPAAAEGAEITGQGSGPAGFVRCAMRLIAGTLPWIAVGARVRRLVPVLLHRPPAAGNAFRIGLGVGRLAGRRRVGGLGWIDDISHGSLLMSGSGAQPFFAARTAACA